MSAIVSALLTIFGIMLLGMITQRRRLFPESMALCLNQFVYWVSLPCLLFSQMCTIPGSDNARALVWGGLAASMLCYLLFYALFSRGFRDNSRAATIRTLGASFPNAAIFGLPFVIMVFPGSEDALNANMICALLYTAVGITADSSLDYQRRAELPAEERNDGNATGAGSARKSGNAGNVKGAGSAKEAGDSAGQGTPGGTAPGRTSGPAMALRFVRELRRNPMVMSSLAGLLVSLLGIEPPQALLRATSLLGSTCGPCALFSMGMVLSAQMSGALGPISLREVLVPLAAVSGLRLLASPFIAYVTLRVAGCSGDMLAAATVTFAMPVAVLVYIVAERYEAKPAETSLAVIVSTLLSLVTLPLVMWLMP